MAADKCPYVIVAAMTEWERARFGAPRAPRSGDPSRALSTLLWYANPQSNQDPDHPR
eukprot:COSAG02_NODE_2210_length_9492_cov_22.862877_3_plen_57_part_00